MNELSAVEAWAGSLLARLSPAARRKATRDIARELRRSQQARIAEQKNPDGTGYEPRKIRSGRKKVRDKRGRIARTAMFTRLRTARWIAIETSDRELAVGFTGRVARLARVHHFGEKSTIAPGRSEHQYPARALLSLTDIERDMIREHLLKHILR